MDNHMLAWMIRGLQLTGQSVNVEILPFYLKSFSELYRAKFKDNSNHHARLRTSSLTDMICQALDDAEAAMKFSRRKPAGKKGPNQPHTSDGSKTRKASK